MAKRLDSPYEPGKRTSAWRKLKRRRRQELVVGGWLAGDGNRANRLGAVLVGYHDDDGRLRYAGRVGSGFDNLELTRWESDLAALATEDCPFDPRPPRPVDRVARYVQPRRVIEVEFQEWTHDDHLRAPSYIGDRFDKEPGDVVREPTTPGTGRDDR
jgi:bifunctional non-homologous end joining protein LigD